MPLLRCTRKLLVEMGVSVKEVSSAAAATEGRLGPWYANLLFIDRRKCVLFVNGKTLASFLVGDLSRQDIRQISEIFRTGFQKLMAFEGFPADLIREFLDEHRELVPATAKDKSVLGSMNDLAANYKYEVPVMGGLTTDDLADSIHKLNRTPMKTLSFAYPIEALRAAVGLGPSPKEEI